jgi:hypothetical protein
VPTPKIDFMARLPLARAALMVWSHVFDDGFLDGVFEANRGRAYRRELSFSRLVGLVLDALVRRRSAHRSLRGAEAGGRLGVSVQAAYGKLGRVPEAVSAALVGEAAARISGLMPGRPAGGPASLAGFAVLTVDGKAVKGVAKRLKPARGRPGAVLGGKFLAAVRQSDGLAVAVAFDPDGECNEASLLPALLPEARARVPGPRLWVADRQFGDLTQPARFAEGGDRFLVRAHPKTGFRADPETPVRTGTDSAGRAWTDDAGWIGAAGRPDRRRVRRLRLPLSKTETLTLYTDLDDPDRFPAADLLEAYLRRGDIEAVFSKVVAVFGLERLIGCSPRATLLQAAVCLVLYDTLVLMRALLAARRGLEADELSMQMLFGDLCESLIALGVFAGPGGPPRPRRRSAAQTSRAVGRLLDRAWNGLWLKAPSGRRRRPPDRPRESGAHTSMHRLILASRRC